MHSMASGKHDKEESDSMYVLRDFLVVMTFLLNDHDEFTGCDSTRDMWKEKEEERQARKTKNKNTTYQLYGYSSRYTNNHNIHQHEV